MILGKKLSEWLELAISDMQDLVKVDGVDFDMRDWVTIARSKKNPKETCFLCLAGCVLYKDRLIPRDSGPISLRIQDKQSRIKVRNFKYYDIELVDACDFPPSSRNLLLFFNSARKGRVDVDALREACQAPAPHNVICWEAFSSAKEELAKRGFLTSNEADFGSDHEVVSCSEKLNLPEGVDRKAAYADHVKEKLQPLLNALKEIGL